MKILDDYLAAALRTLAILLTIGQLELSAAEKLGEAGLRLRPLPPNSNGEDTLIWYNTNDKGGTFYWKHDLDKFLRPYTSTERSENVEDCSSKDQPTKGKVCDFKIDAIWTPCINAYGYGFGSQLGPCVFLSLDKIPNWTPDYYDSSLLPERMPPVLRDTIRESEKKNKHHVVWVNCEGEYPADVENIGPLRYYPQRGFDGKYFPFTDIKGYKSPLVAVFFQRPTHGILINVNCTIWAKNRRGSVHFELLVDDL